MSTKIFIDNARLYAKYEDRKAIRDWEKTHLLTKCDLPEVFKNSYLMLLQYSFIPKFLNNLSDPEVFSDGATGHVLGQLLVRLLEQLSSVTIYATPKVVGELQTKVYDFWEIGKIWEKENKTNLAGNPSDWFEKIEEHEGLRITKN